MLSYGTIPGPAVPGIDVPGVFTPGEPGLAGAQYSQVVYPTPLTWLGIGRELVAGRPVLPTNTVPVGETYQPEDLQSFLRDTSLRSTMSGLFGETRGVAHSSFAYAGPAFLDVDGFFFDNVLGDLSSVSNGVLGSAQPLNAPLAVGATTLAVSASLGSVVTGSVIQIADGDSSEIVIASAGSTGTAVNFAGTPCRFGHTTAATAALEAVSLTYTHTFAQLNSGSGQPPVHSLTDFTNITPGVGARTYPGAVVTQMGLSGNAGALLTRSVSGEAWISAPAASMPVNNVSAAAPVANWQWNVTVGGAPVYNIGDWSLTLGRQSVIYYGAQGSQDPWLIPRGDLGVTFSLDTPVAIREAP